MFRKFKKSLFLKRNGYNRISSMSKIRNKRATRKNWMEKGIRKKNLGLNPHSKGLHFSNIKIDFLLVKIVMSIRMTEINKHSTITIVMAYTFIFIKKEIHFYCFKVMLYLSYLWVKD
jgi:hypothetical protein